MGALLGGVLLTAMIFDTALLFSRRPANTERRLTRLLLARQIAPALYRHRMEFLAHRPRRTWHPSALHQDPWRTR